MVLARFGERQGLVLFLLGQVLCRAPLLALLPLVSVLWLVVVIVVVRVAERRQRPTSFIDLTPFQDLETSARLICTYMFYACTYVHS